jgi:hypothetical protein
MLTFVGWWVACAYFNHPTTLMTTTTRPAPQGIYHKQTRLHWWGVAFQNDQGESFMVSARTPRRAKFLAQQLYPALKNPIAERIEIRKGSTNPKQP